MCTSEAIVVIRAVDTRNTDVITIRLRLQARPARHILDITRAAPAVITDLDITLLILALTEAPAVPHLHHPHRAHPLLPRPQRLIHPRLLLLVHHPVQVIMDIKDKVVITVVHRVNKLIRDVTAIVIMPEVQALTLVLAQVHIQAQVQALALAPVLAPVLIPALALAPVQAQALIQIQARALIPVPVLIVIVVVLDQVQAVQARARVVQAVQVAQAVLAVLAVLAQAVLAQAVQVAPVQARLPPLHPLKEPTAV